MRGGAPSRIATETNAYLCVDGKFWVPRVGGNNLADAILRSFGADFLDVF